MSDQILLEKEELPAKNPTESAVKDGDLLRRSDSSYRSDLIFRIVFGSDCKRGAEHCGTIGVSSRHVSDDARDDEGQKIATMSSKVWIKLGLVILLAGAMIALLAYGFTRDSRYIHSPLVAGQAPSFALTLFDGKVIGLADFRGQAVLVNFWASWCVPCRAEAVALENAWRQHKERGAVFIGVNIQDKDEDARAFMKEFGMTYFNGPDAAGKIAIDYGVWGIPETFFIDPQGRITYKHAGELRAPLIETKLDEALRGIVSAEGKGGSQSIR